MDDGVVCITAHINVVFVLCATFPIVVTFQEVPLSFGYILPRIILSIVAIFDFVPIVRFDKVVKVTHLQKGISPIFRSLPFPSLTNSFSLSENI